MRKPLAKADNSDWAQFERKACIALQAMGYSIDRDVLLAGSQIDIVAKYKEPLHQHLTLVECKSSSNKIGVRDVRALNARVSAVSVKGQSVSGMLISKADFTKAAKQCAQDTGILLTTLEELTAKIIDPDMIAKRTIKHFEDGELGACYVALSCQVAEDGRGTIYKPVEKFLNGFFARTTRSGVAVLGNFGTGKTSLCRHYAYLLSRRWLNSLNASMLPLYINLRDVPNFFSMEKTLRYILDVDFSQHTSVKGFKYWLNNGRTLLLLDGFDEMAAKWDSPLIAKNLRVLMRFITKYSLKTILTCRTHFFKTQVDEKILSNMLRLYISSWGKSEVVDYISQALPRAVDHSIHTIESTYNLEELSKTPVFMAMITATIGDVSNEISQAKLYELYTDRWIDSQDYRSTMLPEEKRQFMHELATEMFSKGEATFPHSLLPDFVRKIMNVSDYDTVRAIDQDVRTCTFLVRTGSGDYHFKHRSFLEFFVARRLAEQIKAGNIETLTKFKMSFEIAGFFASYFEKDYDTLLKQLLASNYTIIRINCAVAIRHLPRSEKIKGVLVSAYELENNIEVKYCITDALIAHGIIELVVTEARNVSKIGEYCFKRLANTIQEKSSHDLYAEEIELHKRPTRALCVLEAVFKKEEISLMAAIKTFGKKKWWRKHSAIMEQYLLIVQAMGDVEMAIALRDLKNVCADSEKILFGNTVNTLRDKFKIAVETEARMNKSNGMIYRDNEGAIYDKYEPIVSSGHLSAYLSGLYGIKNTKVDANKLKLRDRRKLSE